FVSIFSESVNANEVVGINTDQSNLVLYVGDTSSINAFSINGRGDKAAITPIWGSSDNTIASVSNGLVTAVNPGRTEISINYTEGTKTFSKKVYVLVIQNSVAPTDVVGLEVFPESLIMKNNDSKQLQAFLVHADGSETPVKASLVSKNPSILTVNDQTITADIALSAFETTEIIASYNTADGKLLSDTVFVSIFSESVNANEVVGINTDQSNLVLYVGDTSSINAFSINGRGDKAAISPIWGSSDNTIASVSGGLVTAVNPGRTEISINYTEGTKTFSKKVYVLVINDSVAPTDVVGLEVFPSSLVLEKNEISNPLQVYEILANGSQNLITGPSVTALSSDPTIATVSSFSVKGILKGKTSVVVSYLASGVQRNTSIPVTVLNEVADPNSVIGLSANPDVLIMNIGDVRDVSIFEILAAKPKVDVTNINTTFTSANVNIATVTGNTITAINSGVVDITAVHTTSEGDVFDTAITVIVNVPQISSLSIQTCNTVYAKGESFSCTVKATYSNGDSVDISSIVDISSSDELIIQSNKTTRVFYASNVGTASLTFKYGGLTLDHVVTIDPPKVVSVVPNTFNLDLPLSFSQPLKVEAVYSDNHVEDVTSRATYVSSDTGIVSVAADGTVTGITPGTAVIVATFSGVDSNDINITVLNKVLRRLVATPAQLIIPVTFEREITTTAEFSDGTTLDVTDQANYTADNYSIVSLNGNKVTGLSSGITDVRAHYLGETSTTVKVEVTSAVLQRIEVTPANPIIALGYTETLRAEGVFDDGTTIDLSNNVLWTTDNPTVLTSKSFGDYLAATMGVATLGAEYSGVRGETIANVVNKKLIKIIPNNTVVFVPAGISRQITFQGEWSDGSLTPLTAMYWQQTEDRPSNTSDPIVSRVSISGLIETFSAGSSAYTASYAGVSSPPILVLVTAPGITGIEITYLDLDHDGAPDDKIYIGKNTKIKVEATVSTGEIIDVSNDSGLSCTSLDPLTATIVGMDITGVDTGVTAISCNYNNFKRTANLEVTTAFIESITLTSSSSLIDIPTAVTFTVVGHYSDGVDKDITTESVFSIIDSPRDARFFPVLNTDTTTSANDTWYADNLGSATVTATVPNATTLDGVKTASVTVNTDFDRAWYYLGDTYTYGSPSNQVNQEGWRCPSGFSLYIHPTTFRDMITTLLPGLRYEAASRDATNYTAGDNRDLVRYDTGNHVANMVTGELGSVNWATNVHVSCTKKNTRG
ncbi:hypothetical protein I6M27_22175, partial [Shewanella algae]|nr:hypothetical protein [Shewanella algae]